jgi:methionyl aminopeptidase
MPIDIKSRQEIATMRQAGRIVGETLALLQQNIRPGMSTLELDAIAEEAAAKRGAIPSFKGYHGFPASLCVSIDEEVVHGIPNRDRVLHEGAIVSLDFGVIYNGYHGDAAITVAVGEVAPTAQRLVEVTRQALYKGIEFARAGNRLGDISWAVQSFVEGNGFSVVREYVGHGIGRSMHEEPQVPNFGPPARGRPLRCGMVLALEPMVNIGTFKTTVLADGWTVITEDHSLSAHFEHTIAITDGEPEILTAP